MMELIGGSGVYLHRAQFALCKHSAKTQSSLGCQLLRVFFSEEELAKGKLSSRGEEGTLLNQQIVQAIKG